MHWLWYVGIGIAAGIVGLYIVGFVIVAIVGLFSPGRQ
jgi:hypothetical protein